MQAITPKKSLFQRQIPTVVGLVVLVIALILGAIGLQTGPGVFAPRATPQTTPKNVKITNVTDTSFTVSFLTDEVTAGFVKYGTEATSLKSQASDDRDQLSGSISSYPLHHITVRGLQAQTAYYFTLGTGSNSSFDNNGAPFTITTATRGGTPPAAKTIYGSVLSSSGSPAEGSVVYVTISGVGEMSSLVKASGSWAVPLSNARTTDGSQFATTRDTDSITLNVQGPLNSQQSQLTTTIAEAQPVAAITLGQNGISANTPTSEEVAATATPEPTTEALAEATATPEPSLEPAPSESPTSQLTEANTASTSSAPNGAVVTTVNLEDETHQVITTGQPTIVGKAAPNVTINIEVHSETEITQQLVANADGSFSLDISKLEKELEPGEHTVTYSYTDPTTKQAVTKTQTFTVQPRSSTQLALATATPRPFGSGNPFPAVTATPSATPVATKSATTSGRVSLPATTSGIPVSGSIHTTLALIMGGLFFILAGCWSFLIAQGLAEQPHTSTEADDHTHGSRL